MGFGLALSRAIALRPSELRRLEPEHVLVPTACVGTVVFRLGVDVGTKVKREQFALLDSYRWTDLAWILVQLLWGPRYQGKSFSLSATAVTNSGIKAVEQSLNLNIGATPHGARAGFASEEAAAGTPTAEIMRVGRWGSQQCMQMYVDVVVAAQVVSMVSLSSHAIPVQTAAQHFHTFFSYEAFLAQPLSHAAKRRGSQLPCRN